MRFRTLEIRWHDSKPISSCDFQPVHFKKARPTQELDYTAQAYRLATAGEDNHVRIWMVYPSILPPSVLEGTSAISGSSTSHPTPRPPRVEYLSTLSRHSAAVNVVRFSPNGELIASAGDDGMIIIWSLSSSPQQTAYGSDLSQEDLQYEKEYWKPRTSFRCTTMQVYDLAWSPSGDYILAGSTDNVARVFTANDGKCVHEIAEHSHYVQGVAWDPLNEYIATQSSDRSMHVYRISTKHGTFEAHAVGKNMRMAHHHSRAPSTSSAHRARTKRADSTVSDAESSYSEHNREKDKDDVFSSSTSLPGSQHTAPLTPVTSVASTPSMFPPPPIDNPSSRRSSFSGSNAPGSPSQFSRFGRSPSPMPALPAIRTLPSAAASAWASVKLYGDESFTNFFRRLTFSPDGGLLLTPAGHFEDPSVIPTPSRSPANNKSEESTHPRKGRQTSNPSENNGQSSVYIYSRANFARPPVAQLPGHKKASVAVRFSPILYELRQGVIGADSTHETKTGVLEKGKEGQLVVEVVGPTAGKSNESVIGELLSPRRTPLTSAHLSIITSTLQHAGPSASPSMSPTDLLRPPTPSPSIPSTPIMHPATVNTGSVFALPYRMLFAVVTMDTVAIYDTQQSGPICLLSKLHYDEFTDMTWSPDGQCLVLSSRDGYCTIVIFDEILPAHHTQQQSLQVQSIAQHHSVLLTMSTLTPAATPLIPHVALPPSTVPKKRTSRQVTPIPGADEGAPSSSSSSSSMPSSEITREMDRPADSRAKPDERVDGPQKKKRRIALTRVSGLDSMTS